MDSEQIHEQIQRLVEQEQKLRDTGPSDNAEAHAEQLRSVAEQLDQCWDLLRQRRARMDAGEDPDEAEVRPVGEVEGYRQ
ncbi:MULTISPECIES: DUF2630 family protein [Arthrobacter]|uniref:DUF2630 family protein n=1 Tax=Arthrobacter TaxID=1663 RepID=UPI0006DAF2F1|nr:MULTISPECIES: DUF2630 family protein [unclassified Arthrobacter]KPN16410.1 hypothetical protein AO716_16215 [Arthrobacter sp. Edens01]MSR99119.1 DUF2630 family protein [Arthrobacter sp. BL-252-APC-1A]